MASMLTGRCRVGESAAAGRGPSPEQHRSPGNGGPDSYRPAEEPCDHHSEDYSGIGPEEEQGSTAKSAHGASLIATGKFPALGPTVRVASRSHHYGNAAPRAGDLRPFKLMRARLGTSPSSRVESYGCSGRTSTTWVSLLSSFAVKVLAVAM